MAQVQEWKAEDFPCTLTLNIPFPTAHLATTAQKALFVDAELSPLVRRSSILCASPAAADGNSVLRVVYAATTDRMLRVAVNGFFESLGVVVGAMKDLDVDVIYEPTKESLDKVQGLEMDGETKG